MNSENVPKNIPFAKNGEYVHTPVLLNECLEILKPSGTCDWMVDCTLGEGGHSEAFLKKYTSLNIIGIDADSVIIERAKSRLKPFGNRMHFYNGWFNDFFRVYPADYPKPKVILFDLGVSVFHYNVSGRGFSFSSNDLLDMRLDTNNQSVNAANIINESSEAELIKILRVYAQERYARRITKAIIATRVKNKIERASDLANLIYKVVPEKERHKNTHPATKTFMALRIAVNNELGNIKEALHNAFNNLEVGGRLGVITFHSLEDKIVKNYFRNLGRACICPPNVPQCTCGGTPAAKVLTKKAILPADNEVAVNAPSRSAQLRVVEKFHDAINYHLLNVDDGVVI